MEIINIHDYPGFFATLELDMPQQNISIAALTTLAVDAVCKFSEHNFSFSTIDVSFVAFDRELMYPLTDILENNSTWQLREKNVYQGLKIENYWEGQQENILDEMNSLQIVQTIKDIGERQEGNNDNNIVLWKNIIFRAVKCKIDGEPGKAVLLLNSLNKIVEYPMVSEKNAHFVYGPLQDRSIDAPIEINIANNGTNISFLVNIFWSYWTYPDSKGSLEIINGINRLKQDKWMLKSSNLLLISG